MKKIGDVYVNIKAKIDEFKKETQSVDATMEKLKQTGIIKIKGDIHEAEKKLKKLEEIREKLVKKGVSTVRVDADIAKAKQKIESLNAELQNISKVSSNGAGMVTKLSGAFKAFMAIQAVQWAISLGQAIFSWGAALMRAGNEARNTEISFQKMMKSSEKGTEMYNKLSTFAATTPFGDGVMKTGRMLLGMGVEAEKLIPTMTALGDSVKAMGGNDETLMQVSRALGQMHAKGKITGEEMLQLTDAGIPAFKLLSDATGVSVAQLQDLASKGKLGKETIELLTYEIGKSAEGMMDAYNQTSGGMFDNLSADMQTTFAEIGKYLEPVFIATAQIGRELWNIAVGIGQFIKGIIDWTKAISDAIGLTFAFQAIGAIVEIVWIACKGFFKFLGDAFNMAFGWLKPFQDSAQSMMQSFGSWVNSAKNFVKELFGVKDAADTTSDGIEALASSAQKGREEIQKLVSGGADLSQELSAVEMTAANLEAQITNLNNEKKKLHEEYVAGKLSGEEYQQKLAEIEQKLLDAETASQQFKQGLEIVQNEQLSYADKVAMMNGLKLNTSEYNALVAELKRVQQETLTALKLKALLLESSMKGLDIASKHGGTVAKVASNVGVTGLVNKVTDFIPGSKEVKAQIASKTKEIGQNFKESAENYINPELAKTRELIAQAEKDIANTDSLIKKASAGGGGGGGSKKGGGGGSKKESEEEKKAKEQLAKAVKSLETNEKALSKQIDEVRKKTEKAEEAGKKWAKTLADGNKEVEKSFKKIQEEYDKTIEKLMEDHDKSQNEKVGGMYQKLLDEKEALEKAIAQDEYQVFKGQGYEESEDEKKLAKVNAQIAELKEKFSDFSGVMEEVDGRMSVSTEEREYFDFMVEFEKAESKLAESLVKTSGEMMKRRAEIEEQKKVLSFFENSSFMRGAELDTHADLLKNSLETEEAQNMVDKLLAERKNLQQITDEKIQAETFVAMETQRLQQSLHDNQMAMIQAQKEEYKTLIDQINQTIAAARALASMRGATGGKGYAMGGYTGDGGMFEPAGIVHKGEYVIPQSVMSHLRSSLPNVLPMLESIRTGQSVSSNVTNHNHSINLTGPINVRDDIDFEAMIARMKWRGF